MSDFTRNLTEPELRTLSQIALDLEAGADLLDKEGWCRGTNVNAQGHRCILGALEVVQPDDGLRGNAYNAILEQLNDSGLPGNYDRWALVHAWNDAQTDKRSVTRMLRRAARAMRLVRITAA